VFSIWSLPECDKQGTRSELSQFCTGDCEERARAREAEESPLLGAVTKKHFMKTMQAGEYLVQIFCFWTLSIILFLSKNTALFILQNSSAFLDNDRMMHNVQKLNTGTNIRSPQILDLIYGEYLVCSDL
jgi:hypothetical protein